jgi:lactate racemase
MKIDLLYGKGILTVDFPRERTMIFQPKQAAALKNIKESILSAVRSPIGSPPLRSLVQKTDTVAIVFSDITRPLPYKAILPIILNEFDVPDHQITLINALGTHRPNSNIELEEILGREVLSRYKVLQHNCRDKTNLLSLGKSSCGHEIWINRHYMESSVKILTGFIEPHLFAGYSGGPKAVLPGIAGLDTIIANHGADMIGHSGVGFNKTYGNPIWEEILEVALRTKPSFLLNITQNENRNITGVFAGSLELAHRQGVKFVRELAVQEIDKQFDIVVSTASGYPLDMNLYQSVKGIAAAGKIVKDGGTIILVTECREGLPAYGEYGDILQLSKKPQDLLKMVHKKGFFMQDQWDAQIQAQICQHANLYIYSDGLSDDEIKQAYAVPCRNLEQTLDSLYKQYGPNPQIAVLPAGSLTVPVLTDPIALQLY